MATAFVWQEEKHLKTLLSHMLHIAACTLVRSIPAGCGKVNHSREKSLPNLRKLGIFEQPAAPMWILVAARSGRVGQASTISLLPDC